MSEVKTFFRHCPACGRRFEIRIVKKTTRNGDTYGSEIPGSEPVEMRARAAPLLVFESTEPVTVEEKEFTYQYVCKHCGHQWTETREGFDVEPTPEGYTGD